MDDYSSITSEDEAEDCRSDVTDSVEHTGQHQRLAMNDLRDSVSL